MDESEKEKRMLECRALTFTPPAPSTGRRRRRILGCLAAAALLLPASAAAQQQTDRAVFVSRLKAEPVDYQVKLTWIDSPDIAGTCLVYRAAEEITTQNLPAAALVGTVPTGTGWFVDTPPDRAGYFYAVLLRDSAGTDYALAIPFRNKTSAAVAPATSAPEEKLAARISGLKAAVTAAGDAIEISFGTSNPARDLLLFWGSSPFTAPEDLLESASTAPLDAGTTRYTLPALTGVDYWFAVLDAGMYKLGKAEIQKGVNATAAAVSMPANAGRSSLAAAATAAHRSTPLPSLALAATVGGGQALDATGAPGLPAARKVSKAADEAIARLMKGVRRQVTKFRQPQVLPADATPSPDGEVARLQQIVRGPFLAGDITSAKKGLLDYLRLPRSQRLEAHARFYLGQVYYIEGGVREALMEFLSAEDDFYQETEPWIDACIARLVREGL
jgi:hypothetical protein